MLFWPGVFDMATGDWAHQDSPTREERKNKKEEEEKSKRRTCWKERSGAAEYFCAGPKMESGGFAKCLMQKNGCTVQSLFPLQVTSHAHKTSVTQV